MFRVVLCLAVLVAVQAMSTTMMSMTTKHHHGGHHSHGTHGTTEATEKDAFKFIYEGHTQQMLLVNHHSCYIFTLSDTERTAVHTDAGLRTLELKLVNMLTSGTSTEVQLQDQPKQIQHACGGAAHTTHTYTVV